MKIALLSFCDKGDSKSAAIVRAVLKSAEDAGKNVELFDGFLDDGKLRLALFDYIAVIAKKKGFFGGRVHERAEEFFATAPSVAGKKGAAFIVQSGPFGNGKACSALMQLLEKEGVLLDYFDIIGGLEAARACGEKLG